MKLMLCSLKLQKWLIFVFSADGSKNLVLLVWVNCLSQPERSYLAVLENAMDYWVMTHKPLKIQNFGYFYRIFKTGYFYPQYLTNVSSKAY